MSALVVLLAFIAVGPARLAALPAAARAPRPAGPAGLRRRGASACSTCWSMPAADADRDAPIRRRSPPAPTAQETVELPGGKRGARVPAAAATAARISKDEADRDRDVAATRAAGRRPRRSSAGGSPRGSQRRCSRAGAGFRRRDVERRAAARDRCAVAAPSTLTALALALIAVPVALLATKLPRARHRQGRTGRALPRAEEHPHRPRDRHADHAGDAAVRDRCSGIMAGYFRGWIDDVIQYVYTTHQLHPGRAADRRGGADDAGLHRPATRSSFPTAAQRADFRLLLLCVILGLTSWTGLARLLRGEALKLSRARVHPGGARVRRARRRASSRATSCRT